MLRGAFRLLSRFAGTLLFVLFFGAGEGLWGGGWLKAVSSSKLQENGNER